MNQLLIIIDIVMAAMVLLLAGITLYMYYTDPVRKKYPMLKIVCYWQWSESNKKPMIRRTRHERSLYYELQQDYPTIAYYCVFKKGVFIKRVWMLNKMPHGEYVRQMYQEQLISIWENKKPR